MKCKKMTEIIFSFNYWLQEINSISFAVRDSLIDSIEKKRSENDSDETDQVSRTINISLAV